MSSAITCSYAEGTVPPGRSAPLLLAAGFFAFCVVVRGHDGYLPLRVAPKLLPVPGSPVRLLARKVGPMIRGLVVAAAAACVAVGSAPVAVGDPNDNLYFDKPGRYDSDVPFMNYEARLAAPCDNFEINTF